MANLPRPTLAQGALPRQATRRARCTSGVALALLVGLLAAGCGRKGEPERGPVALPVEVLADTGHIRRLPRARFAGAAAPGAAVWMTRVSPRRAPLEVPVPTPRSETLAVPPPSAALVVDENLKPPILRAGAALRVPRGARGVVELDVRVAEDGSVSDALWAGGSSDSTLIESAVAAALAMRFYPALQGDRPVAVWCRQRFDFMRR
jgi:TonB family protein